MTDELSPEFLEFSEMLDREDSLDESSLNDDGRILMDLREALREEASVAPSGTDSAKEMAEAVLRAQSQLPLLSRFLVRSEHLLFRSVLAGKVAWLQGGAFAAALALVGYFEPSSALVLGFVSLAASLGWLSWSNSHAEEKFRFLQTSERAVQSVPRWIVGSLFYAVPVLSVVFVGWAFGGLFAQLEGISYSSMSKGGNPRLVGGLAAIGVWCLLLSALRPSWQAFRECSGGSRWRLFMFQFFHWVPMLIGMLITALNESGGDPQYDSGLWDIFFVSSQGKGYLDQYFEFFSRDFMPPGLIRAVAPLAVLLFALGLWTLLISALSAKPQRTVPLKKAMKRSVASLLLSILPIALSVFVFYQLHLTREIQDPRAYLELVESSEAWLRERSSVPDEENGWIELRPYFIKPEQDKAENREVAKRLGQLGQLYNFNSAQESWRIADPEQFKSFKSDFLTELPRIRSSMSKPKYSVIATEGFGFEKMVPNFILYRGVSQGLALLVEDSIEGGDTTKALDYATLGISWANKDESGVLIDQMIRVACFKIALESYESLLTRGNLNREQLILLKEALRHSTLSIDSFGQAMKHEVYAADFVLMKIRDGDSTAQTEIGESMLDLVPSSYVESERKAYINFSLVQIQNWNELASSDWSGPDSVNPLNLVSRILAPNTRRAGLQFRAAHARESIIGLTLAIEEFRLDQGVYPSSLEELVPDFLPELPRDAMQPERWSMKPGFQYEKTDSGFQLMSVSESYRQIQLKARQVYDSQKGWLGKRR